MKQLIELQIVPAQVEYRRTESKMEYVNADIKMQMKSHDGGGLQMQNKPAKVNIDSYACRSSIGPGFQSVGDNLKNYASKGISDAQSSTATFASRGQQMMKTQRGEEMITKFAKQDTYKNVKMNIGIDFIPRVAPEITVDKGELTVQFEMDKLEFDWKMTEQEIHFTPGSITVEMVQRPDVIVRYVGGPNYVPKASDPNFAG